MVHISGRSSGQLFLVAGCLVLVLHAPRNSVIKTAGMNRGCFTVFFVIASAATLNAEVYVAGD